MRVQLTSSLSVHAAAVCPPLCASLPLGVCVFFESGVLLAGGM
jgi:hypothetical protein